MIMSFHFAAGVKTSLNNKENSNVNTNSTVINAAAEGKILGRLVCGICKFKTNIPSIMKSHMRKHLRKKKVICDKCFREFNKGVDLVFHIRKVHKKFLHNCNKCTFNTSKLTTLRKHIAETHECVKQKSVEDAALNGEDDTKKPIENSIDKPKFTCFICEYPFNKIQFLRRHMKLHEGKEPFVCAVCGNYFKEPDDMERISNSESGQYQYQCKCKCIFTLVNPLKPKLIFSESERPFECGVCSCKFRLPHILYSHMKCHAERTAYKCNKCSNTFRLMAHLESHMKAHKP